MKASVCDLPTIDIIALRKDQQSTGYGRAGDRMTHLHGRIDRFTSGELQISGSYAFRVTAQVVNLDTGPERAAGRAWHDHTFDA